MNKQLSNLTFKIRNFELKGILSITVFTIAIFYWIIVSTCHLIATDFLTDWVTTPLGKFIPRDSSLNIGLLVCILILIYILYNTFNGSQRLLSLLYWLFLGVSVWLAFRFLICAPIEIIHFPQYAILSYLFAYSCDKKREKMMLGKILFWITFMGIIDEVYQYFYVTRQFSDYLDFNDFILNEIGAALGLILFYGFRERDVKSYQLYKIIKSIEFQLALILIIIIIILNITGVIQFHTNNKINSAIMFNKGSIKIFLEKFPHKYSHWETRDLGGYYFILDSIKGILIMILFGIIMFSYQLNLFKFNRLNLNKLKSYFRI